MKTCCLEVSLIAFNLIYFIGYKFLGNLYATKCQFHSCPSNDKNQFVSHSNQKNAMLKNILTVLPLHEHGFSRSFHPCQYHAVVKDSRCWILSSFSRGSNKKFTEGLKMFLSFLPH